MLERFEQEIWSKVPHLEETKIVNATPLTDLTEDLKECAKSVYKTDFTDMDLKVFGKFDSNLLTGSIKVRAAVHIIHDAIVTGKLKSGQTVIEATSGNFGIALGLLSKLGLVVVTLVSRKLQEGVFKKLRNENIRIMDLDMDICPAPGMKDDAVDLLAAKATAVNIRSQLSELGFDPAIFDKENSEIESLLVKEDIINLAKFLAKIYGLFCPEQYDNELNIDVHRTVTAVEIDQQLHENGNSLEDFEIVCTFGTGGTSGGLSRYVSEKYGKKSLHVVFPPAGQDVAGIRTKDKAFGLKLYEPEKYAGEHEVDFEQAKHLLKFFVDKGHDIGESTALALYEVLVMADSSGGGKFVVIVADGIEKYRKNLEVISKNQRVQVSLDEAVASANDYDKIIWIHTQYTPREEGIELIAKSLGVDKSKISVPKASTANQLLSTQQIPEELKKELQGSKGKSLLICMAGNTSLMATKVLAAKGIVTESLNGGITELPEGKNTDPSKFIKVATE
ncbi:pyridoxal-phosphate dependent enzyme [Marine Group I thaumarchaeote]|uniref:Pyridoxal-phosphate dependent enzyme n=1 Tax=Marine Group I thaumarchaeote TaxID=2511932 RepID=A0A7K4MS02_9ARCH|nr:MAG: pyridoxal-phosphate dependent enzyme [Nitrosopumilus sp. YT1]NWJ56270.1 pyridoxal-phosphate dependent enzyme [Marine Group I thaumarchaeote]NWJ84099.1 pyridoxal-phosphate dependent enzyme [Marine Group I thaumarchaeote]